MRFPKRAGGWCKSVKAQIFPLLELSVNKHKPDLFMQLGSRKGGSLYPAMLSGRCCNGNLGGNAESFRPNYLWERRIFFIV
ncbi:hypothetical protein R2R35_05900 [Anaerocolumna sp. AGMB13020]|uniref:hypothetical protein n=1 Tax=Anaerocolumna sp. AGMB13020 TaxID=3081750 RepID=UPI002953FAD6|nr:hypothetical protein [Anaerocolumna sp. AGMB13020]WOO38032.1 hypothetical protein R2R35_05900 [Anaerocolumna sp. AGMB13020]